MTRHLDLDVTALFAYTENFRTLAERVGVSRRTLHRDAHRGLTVDQADRYAAHPSTVWPCWTELSYPSVHRTSCRWCTTEIVQDARTRGPRRRTCSQRCRDALSRSRHLDQRRAADRARWAASRTPERLAAHAAAERRRRARVAA